MKLVLIPIVGALLCSVGCEGDDIRTQAANMVYKNCISSGNYTQWCKCLRADLLDTISEENAYEFISGRTSLQLQMQMFASRARCECRERPIYVTSYGLPCDEVKPLKY